MSQININSNPVFEKNLIDYMRMTGIPQKSKAIREALREALALHSSKKKQVDFSQWLGAGLKAGLNHKPRFKSDDDLWGA